MLSSVHNFHSNLRALALSTSALAAGAVFLPSATQAIAWDWLVGGIGIDGTPGSITGSGTFTTDGDTPTVGTTYTVTGVTGSFFADALGTFSVTGLRTLSNFQWSGEGTNQLLVKLLSPDNILLSEDGGSKSEIQIVAISFSDFIPDQEVLIRNFDFASSCFAGIWCWLQLQTYCILSGPSIGAWSRPCSRPWPPAPGGCRRRLRLEPQAAPAAGGGIAAQQLPFLRAPESPLRAGPDDSARLF
jgi:hypothetical protein